MRNKKTRRGFTIVELVIVVAVIGVIAAILIPTFVNLTSKANRAADDSLVANLNKALAMAEVDDTEYHGKSVSSHNDTMHDAVIDLEYEGYHLENLTTRTNLNLLWNKETNRFLLDDAASMNKQANKESKIDFWKIVKSVGEMGEYSGYAHTNFNLGTGENEGKISVTTGFDAGYKTGIKEISFETDEAKVLTIRTNSVLTDLKINAPHSTVHHYGEVGKVDITKIDMNCYNEFGNSKYVKVTEGKVVAKANGTIDIVFANNTDGSKVAVIEEPNGTIISGYTRVEEVDTANQARENGIELTYAIYVDETTTITGDDFVSYVESSAEYAVETAKQAEEAAQTEPSLGPTGTFADPFIEEDVVFGDLIIINGETYGSESSSTDLGDDDDDEISLLFNGTSATLDGYKKEVTFIEEDDEEETPSDNDSEWVVTDTYIANKHCRDVISAINSTMVEPTWYFDNDPTATESDVAAVICENWIYSIAALDEGIVDVTFKGGEYYNFGTIRISVVDELPDVSEIPARDDGKNVYSLNDVPQDVNITSSDGKYINLANIQNGSTIKFLRDYSEFIEFYAKNNKSITVDLNGYSIKNLNFRSITVNIIDSSVEKSGKVETLTFACWYGLNNPNFVFDSWKDDVTRNDYHEGEGYQYLEVWMDNPAKLTLLGGSIQTLSLMDCAEVVVAGATIINTDPVSYTTGHAISVGIQYRYISITIKSGIVVGQKDFYNAGKVSISGGYFSEEVSSAYLASGYKCVKINDAMYKVVSAD